MRIKLYLSGDCSDDSIRYSNVLRANTRASLLVTGLHHMIHYLIIFWIRGLNCTLCLSEKEYCHEKMVYLSLEIEEIC